MASRRSRHADRKCSVVAQAQGGTPEKMAATSFEQMGLDARLLRVRGEGRGGGVSRAVTEPPGRGDPPSASG